LFHLVTSLDLQQPQVFSNPFGTPAGLPVSSRLPDLIYDRGRFLIRHQTQGLWSGHQTQLESVQSCETAKIVDTGALTAQLAELYAH